MLEHLAYLPDLATCNFFLFNEIKDAMRWTHLGSLEEVKAKTAWLLKAILESEWAKCFESWKNQMCWCIVAEGNSTYKS